MILLSILKIIGIVLLVILGILFLLICIVLFDPVHYQMKGELHKNNTCILVKSSWLFHILGFTIDYSKGQMDSYFRILFFKKSFAGSDGKNSKKEKRKVEEDSTENETKKDDVLLGQDKVSESVLYIDSKENDVAQEDEMSNQEEEDILDSSEEEDLDIDAHRNSKKKRGRPDFFEQFQRKKEKLVSKVKEIGKIKENAIDFFEDPHNKRAIHHMKKEVVYLLKVIYPGKMKFELKFSLGDPAYTGIALGILAMFPVGYNNRWNIQPDFESEEAYADGTFDVKGFLFAYQILFLVIRLVIDKECRRMYNKYKK